MDFLAEGGADAVIESSTASRLIDELLAQLGSPRRVLLVPPDITRRASGAGELTARLFERLAGRSHVDVLPATGTHRAMTSGEIAAMFPGVPAERFYTHDWQGDLRHFGTIPAAVLRELSGGRVKLPVDVAVNHRLATGDYDRIISIGQLVPHEVAGIANHAKNVVVGLGGRDFINKSHFLGAVVGMERILGRAHNPVRDLINRAAALTRLPIVYLLSVRSADAAGRPVTRGLFAGDDAGCFRRGAALCRQVNVTRLDRPPKKVVVWLDSAEYPSTWLGNKAIYRTRLAVADGGELIILAPGVCRFGEQPEIDAAIRAVGYRGTEAVLRRVACDAELAANLAAAAHLIHGSSEGRFTIRYCPGGLSRVDVEGVGYEYGDGEDYARRYRPDQLHNGWNRVGGEDVYFVSQPGQGLWVADGGWPSEC